MQVIDRSVGDDNFHRTFDDLAGRVGAQRWVVVWSDGENWYRFGRRDPRDDTLAALASTRPGDLDRVDPADLGGAGARLRAAGLSVLSSLTLDDDLQAVVFFEHPTEPLTDLGPVPGWFGMALREADRHAGLVALESWTDDLAAVAGGHVGPEELLPRTVVNFGLEALVVALPAPRGVQLMSSHVDGSSRPAFAETIDFEASWADLERDPAALFDRLPAGRPEEGHRSVVAGEGASVLVAVETSEPIGRVDFGVLATLMGQVLDRQHETGRARSRAQLEERSRLATVLHEELSQRLAAVSIQIDLVANRHGDAVADDLAQLRAGVVDALEALRSAIYELTPPEPDWMRLADGLERFVDDHARSRGLRVGFRVEGSPSPVDPEQVSLVFAVVQEALTNVAKHAGTDEAEVQVDFGSTMASVSVVDEGEGLVTHPFESARWGHQGLGVLRTRARLAGAVLEITGQPGQGTTVKVAVPISDHPDPCVDSDPSDQSNHTANGSS